MLHLRHKKIYVLILILLGISILVKVTVLKADDKSLFYTVEKGTFVESVQVAGTYNRTFTDEEKAQAYASYQQAVSALTTANQNKQAQDATMWVKRQSILDAKNNINYKNDNTTNPATKNEYTDLEKLEIDSSLTSAEKDYTASELKYEQAGVAIAAAQAQVAAAKIDYDDTLIDEPLLAVDVNEVYIPKLYLGQKVNITFDALKDKVLTGNIKSIDSIGTVSNGIVTFEVKVAINNLPATIKPNMTATAQIDLINKDDTIAIPKSSIILKDDKAYVQKINDKSGMLTEVQLGKKGFARVEVLSGLPEGTRIVANTDIRAQNDK